MRNRATPISPHSGPLMRFLNGLHLKGISGNLPMRILKMTKTGPVCAAGQVVSRWSVMTAWESSPGASLGDVGE